MYLLLLCRVIRVLAEVLYYSLTTGSGAQTLGEEYCDILQVSSEHMMLPPPFDLSAAIQYPRITCKVVKMVCAVQLQVGGWRQAFSAGACWCCWRVWGPHLQLTFAVMPAVASAEVMVARWVTRHQ